MPFVLPVDGSWSPWAIITGKAFSDKARLREYPTKKGGESLSRLTVIVWKSRGRAMFQVDFALCVRASPFLFFFLQIYLMLWIRKHPTSLKGDETSTWMVFHTILVLVTKDGKIRIQVLVLWNVAEGTRGHIGHAQIQHQGWVGTLLLGTRTLNVRNLWHWKWQEHMA